jgi:hypothetical protein
MFCSYLRGLMVKDCALALAHSRHRQSVIPALLANHFHQMQQRPGSHFQAVAGDLLGLD